MTLEQQKSAFGIQTRTIPKQIETHYTLLNIVQDKYTKKTYASTVNKDIKFRQQPNNDQQNINIKQQL